MNNILVTAVGAELAFSIIKAIKQFKIETGIIGCDIYPEVAGKYWVDCFHQVPLASSEFEYISAVKELVKAHGINVIIPSTDLEMTILSKYKHIFKKNYNCYILVNETKEIEIFNDKWLSHCWYEKNSIPTSQTFLAEDVNNLLDRLKSFVYPLIIKPRKGGGSRHIYKVHNRDELLRYLPIVPEPIIQTYLAPEDEEYTIGTYRNIDDQVYTIVLKRTLKFGMTNTAKVVFDQKLGEFAKDVILKTNLIGSNNVQCRLTIDGPKVLEINPRFSGTTAIRASFGFNDVEMWVDEVLTKRSALKPAVRSGFVLRHMDDQYHFEGLK
jgi:carbamoyl-phosphate synthase large subunit